MLAKQMSRGYGRSVGYGASTLGGGFRNDALSPATSTFAEVADDADFDLDPHVNLLDAGMQNMVDQQSGRASGVVEDDFEMRDGDAERYEVASPSADIPAEGGVEAPSAESAATSPESTAPASDPLADAALAPSGGEAVIDHSVSTGGDVLLDAALEEERDLQNRMKGGRRRLRRSATTALGPDRFLVYCPNGHRIQVHGKHRGRTGRCPNCKAIFFVPAADVDQTLGEAGGTAEGAAVEGGGAADSQSTGYTRWITDVYLHRLNPAKLKLKPGSLVGEHEVADVGLCSEHLLLAVLFAGGGPFRGMQEAKKKAATRQAMLDHLGAKLPLADLPIPSYVPLTSEALQQLKIVQPPIPGEESLFADVPVFGEGRVAVRIPAADVGGERAYLSFALSQFRDFSSFLSESFGLIDFGAGTSIPMTDVFEESSCHYSDTTLHSLPADRLVFYRSDPKFKVNVIGRRCQKCGLVVSEDSRKKEKIGGTSDSSIAFEVWMPTSGWNGQQAPFDSNIHWGAQLDGFGTIQPNNQVIKFRPGDSLWLDADSPPFAPTVLVPIIFGAPSDPDHTVILFEYIRQLSVTQGTPVTWSLLQAPPGAQIDQTGKISGWKPSSGFAGATVHFQVQASNSLTNSTASWDVQVQGTRDATSNGFHINYLYAIKNYENPGGQSLPPMVTT
jgi:hypothetical protein